MATPDEKAQRAAIRRLGMAINACLDAGLVLTPDLNGRGISVFDAEAYERLDGFNEASAYDAMLSYLPLESPTRSRLIERSQTEEEG